MTTADCAMPDRFLRVAVQCRDASQAVHEKAQLVRIDYIRWPCLARASARYHDGIHFMNAGTENGEN